MSENRQEFVSEMTVLPQGMPLNDPDLWHFMVTVKWRGPLSEDGGGYAIINTGYHLSHGGLWRPEPPRGVRRHYRWPDRESALNAARSIVDRIQVNGKTWREVLADRASSEVAL